MEFMKKSVSTAGLMLISVSSFAVSNTYNGAEYIAGELVVKLKTSSLETLDSVSRSHQLLNSLSEKYDVTLSQFQTDENLLTVKINNSSDMGSMIKDITSQNGVEYAEPNYVMHSFGTEIGDPTPVIPNDANFKLDWGLLNTGQNDSGGQAGIAGKDIGATKAWNITTGSSEMVVAVIDTGVDYTHEELKENIYINKGEIPGNGIDDDSNGFVDDVHGWNFNTNTNEPMDDNKHGTHVSGTIGAKGDNGIGTAGVNWSVRILPIKFLSSTGSGSLTGAVNSINYATKMGVKIMSNSWGGGGYTQSMFDAIKAAQAKGILFVAAAGNGDQNGNAINNDTTPAYPASYKLDNVMSVAASDNRDNLATFSNYGAKSVHLSAPGVKIYSTVPTSKGGYATFSGTSMACPHVSGAAALVWSMNKDMTYLQIKDRLMKTVDTVPGMKSKNITGGRLNVYNALMNIQSNP